MKKYESYKDSGIEWIGEIPEHWNFYNLKFILREGVKDGPHETPVWFDDGIPFLSIDGIVNGEISFDKCRYIDEQQFEQFSKKLIIEKDDIFIGKAASIGKIARVKTNRKFTVWSPIAVVKLKKEFNPIFVEYYFRSDILQHQIELLSTSNTQKNIAMGDIPKMKFIAPTEDEQTSIANYLDRKTTQIDSLIAKKEKFINLLQEERVAIINQAVTKGLDPKVKMKDSGIEWLGEIPDHWKITRLNQIIKVKDGTHESPLQISKSETTFPLITSKDFKNGEINFENAKYISKEDHKNIIKRSNTEKGDIIMSMIGGNIGNLVYIQTDREFSIKNVCLFKTSFNTIYAKHLYYILKSPLLKIQIDLCSRGGAQGFLSLGDLRSLVYFVLPEKEIKSIVLHIENKEIRIEQLISKTQQEIELLKEYKTALISEVVTGKVDVRDLVN